jgi:hypothetical protein
MSWIHHLWDSRKFHRTGALLLAPVDWLYSLWWSMSREASVPYWSDWQNLKMPSFPLPYARHDLPVKTSRSDNAGSYLVSMVATHVDKSLLAPLLPAQLEFDPTPRHGSIDDNLHPVIYMFGFTQHLHFVWLPMRGFGYLEFAVAIPALRLKQPGNKFAGPFTYVPLLYLHQLYPIVLGWMVGYHKERRKMSTDFSRYSIRSRDGQHEVIRAEFNECAPPEQGAHEDHVSHWAHLTMQPQVNQFADNTLLFLHYHLDWGNCVLQPVEAKLDVFSDEGVPGLKPGHYEWPGINTGRPVPGHAPEGAFRLWAPFELLAPFTRRKLDGWIPPQTS